MSLQKGVLGARNGNLWKFQNQTQSSPTLESKSFLGFGGCSLLTNFSIGATCPMIGYAIKKNSSNIFCYSPKKVKFCNKVHYFFWMAKFTDIYRQRNALKKKNKLSSPLMFYDNSEVYKMVQDIKEINFMNLFYLECQSQQNKKSKSMIAQPI